MQTARQWLTAAVDHASAMAKQALKLEGAKELEKMFRTLGDRVHRKVTRQAVNAAATPVVKAAKQNADASKESGTLKKSLGKKVKTYKKSQSVSALVGPRRNVEEKHDGKPRKPSRYAHLVESGHVDEHGNHVPGQPFLRPALDQTEGQALDIMESKMAEGVLREAAKAAGGKA